MPSALIHDRFWQLIEPLPHPIGEASL